MGRLAALLSRLARRRGRAAGTTSGGVVTSEVTTPHEQVVDYWTDERMREAQPREQRLDPPDRRP
jgi:hypothetical protein